MHKKGYYAAERAVDDAVAAVRRADAERAEKLRADLRAARAERAAMPPVPVEVIRAARVVRLRDGVWQVLVKVNRSTVTVEKYGIQTKRPLRDVIGVGS